MWHFSQNSPKAIIFAKQLLYSVELSGKKVFPDSNTAWHFDDKLGQKYLFEAIEAPVATTWVFYDKNKAFNWIDTAQFPKVFKLRGGAGSQNVRLVSSKREAKKLARRAFTVGFPSYDGTGAVKEVYRKLRIGKASMQDLAESIIRLVLPPHYARVRGRERGYIYFQNYIPQNNYDIRIIVIGDKAFGIKRMVRSNDFRASGSGEIIYDRDHINDESVRLSFHLAEKLQSQCVAFDFVYDKGLPLLLEISYGFMKEGYDPCPGYWDKDLNWHEGIFDPYGWMVEDLIKSINKYNRVIQLIFY